MKKLLIVLMIVAMASFLFVGCFGTTPDIPDEDEEPAVAVTGVTLDKAILAFNVGDASVTLVATVAPADATDLRVIWASSDEAVATVALGVVTPLNVGISAITATTVDGGFVATCVVTVTSVSEPLPTSTTPVIGSIANVEASLVPIINLYSSETQYMNEDEVEDGILVFGSAPKYSDIQVYVDGAVVGTSISYGVLEGFIVFVAEDDLGVDGEKTLYATATEVGLDESDASIEYAFTLDTVAPELVKVAAEVDEDFEGTVTATFDEAVDEDIAEDEGNWLVKNITVDEAIVTVLTAELTAKVVELKGDWEGDPAIGNLIRVTCEVIEDLAGNEATDLFGYCYLEGEVPEPEPEPDHVPAEIKVDISTFTLDEEGIFTVDLVANDDEGEMVKISFTLPPGHVGFGEDPLYTIEWLLADGETWVDLTDPLFSTSWNIGIYNATTGVVAVPEVDGEPLADMKITFKGTFFATGTFETTVEVRTYPGDVLLCSEDITAVVVGP